MRYELPGFKPRSKARPRQAGRVMFVPKEYKDWKQAVRDYLAASYSPVPIYGPCRLAIEIHAPSKPAGDIDNIAGGLMDAIQPIRAKGDVRAQRALEQSVSIEDRLAASPGALLADDRQVVELSIRWVKTKQRAIVIEIEEQAA